MVYQQSKWERQIKPCSQSQSPNSFKCPWTCLHMEEKSAFKRALTQVSSVLNCYLNIRSICVLEYLKQFSSQLVAFDTAANYWRIFCDVLQSAKQKTRQKTQTNSRECAVRTGNRLWRVGVDETSRFAGQFIQYRFALYQLLMVSYVPMFSLFSFILESIQNHRALILESRWKQRWC